MNPKRVLLAGLVGTAVMTALMLMAPLMSLPKMPMGQMLGSFLHIGSAAGAIDGAASGPRAAGLGLHSTAAR